MRLLSLASELPGLEEFGLRIELSQVDGVGLAGAWLDLRCHGLDVTLHALSVNGVFFIDWVFWQHRATEGSIGYKPRA